MGQRSRKKSILSPTALRGWRHRCLEKQILESDGSCREEFPSAAQEIKNNLGGWSRKNSYCQQTLVTLSGQLARAPCQRQNLCCREPPASLLAVSPPSLLCEPARLKNGLWSLPHCLLQHLSVCVSNLQKLIGLLVEPWLDECGKACFFVCLRVCLFFFSFLFKINQRTI